MVAISYSCKFSYLLQTDVAIAMTTPSAQRYLQNLALKNQIKRQQLIDDEAKKAQVRERERGFNTYLSGANHGRDRKSSVSNISPNPRPLRSRSRFTGASPDSPTHHSSHPRDPPQSNENPLENRRSSAWALRPKVIPRSAESGPQHKRPSSQYGERGPGYDRVHGGESFSLSEHSDVHKSLERASFSDIYGARDLLLPDDMHDQTSNAPSLPDHLAISPSQPAYLPIHQHSPTQFDASTLPQSFALPQSSSLRELLLLTQMSATPASTAVITTVPPSAPSSHSQPHSKPLSQPLTVSPHSPTHAQPQSKPSSPTAAHLSDTEAQPHSPRVSPSNEARDGMTDTTTNTRTSASMSAATVAGAVVSSKPELTSNVHSITPLAIPISTSANFTTQPSSRTATGPLQRHSARRARATRDSSSSGGLLGGVSMLSGSAVVDPDVTSTITLTGLTPVQHDPLSSTLSDFGKTNIPDPLSPQPPGAVLTSVDAAVVAQLLQRLQEASGSPVAVDPGKEIHRDSTIPDEVSSHVSLDRLPSDGQVDRQDAQPGVNSNNFTTNTTASAPNGAASFTTSGACADTSAAIDATAPVAVAATGATIPSRRRMSLWSQRRQADVLMHHDAPYSRDATDDKDVNSVAPPLPLSDRTPPPRESTLSLLSSTISRMSPLARASSVPDTASNAGYTAITNTVPKLDFTALTAATADTAGLNAVPQDKGAIPASAAGVASTNMTPVSVGASTGTIALGRPSSAVYQPLPHKQATPHSTTASPALATVESLILTQTPTKKNSSDFAPLLSPRDLVIRGGHVAQMAPRDPHTTIPVPDFHMGAPDATQIAQSAQTSTPQGVSRKKRV